MRLPSVTAACIFLGLALAQQPKCSNPRYLKVETQNGQIAGHLADETACVVEYLGIPYAKPPVKDLRFAPPKKLVAKAKYEAAKYGADCPLAAAGPSNYPNLTPQAQRIIDYFASGSGTPQSEDCLTLNVWSSGNSKAKAKPVWVFFYGGRFAIGNTNSPFYNGKYFAEAEDIIVVTVNYRLNIFGFPGAPGEKQNLGLRDQRAAVEWLRDNIAQFGGDPKKITISGQSSGGVAVDYWTYAYTKDPIANGVFAPSGNAFSFPVNAPGVPEEHWNEVVDAVNCTDAKNVMSCMRKVDFKLIEAAAAAVRPTPSSSVLRSIPPFYPQPDGEIVFSDYLARTEAGKFAKLPIILGNNNNEDGYYRIPAFRNGITPLPEQVKLFLLESFTCPVSFQAKFRQENKVPVWTYRYMADWDNTRLFPTSGAYHGVDLHMIFGASGDVSGIEPSEEQKKLTKYTQKALFTFCNDPQKGLEGLGWPKFDRQKKSLALLGKGNKATAQFVKPSEYDALCSTITLGALSVLTGLT